MANKKNKMSLNQTFTWIKRNVRHTCTLDCETLYFIGIKKYSIDQIRKKVKSINQKW